VVKLLPFRVTAKKEAKKEIAEVRDEEEETEHEQVIERIILLMCKLRRQRLVIS